MTRIGPGVQGSRLEIRPKFRREKVFVRKKCKAEQKQGRIVLT